MWLFYFILLLVGLGQSVLNPGLAIGLAKKSKPEILLHPTLTSTKYLESQPKRRQAKEFEDLKNQLLAQTDNVAVESAPFESLPQSYQSILPTSYYATHTFIPPVANLYANAFAGKVSAVSVTFPNFAHPIGVRNGGIVKTAEEEESSRTSQEPREIKNQEANVTVTKEEKIEEEALAEFEADFKPSHKAPSFVIPRASPLKDSSFGVSVTPLSITADGLKREISSNDKFNEISKTYARPSFKLSKPPIAQNWLRQAPLLRRPQSYDQIASEGHKRQVTFVDQSPANNALLYLGPSGPSVPVASKVQHDFSHMVQTFSQGPLREIINQDFSSIQKEPLMPRISHAMKKIMGGHIGDRSFDAFDWVPLLALLVATGLILAGLFPNGLNTLGLNGGSLVLGRKGRYENEDEGVLGQTLGHLETGVMMMSALRYEDGCAERLACRLGKMAATSEILKGPTAQVLFEGVSAVLPQRYNGFARSFQAVANHGDDSSCQKECYRCISI